jgi:hypothetical protein
MARLADRPEVALRLLDAAAELERRADEMESIDFTIRPKSEPSRTTQTQAATPVKNSSERTDPG